MKKKIFGMFALFIAIPFFFGFKNKPSKNMLQSPVNATLNGVDGPTARTMIANFQSNCANDKNSKSVEAWYSIAQIRTISKLLTAERKSYGTDGVRIYLGSDDPKVTGTSKLNISIFLVSTKPQSIPNHSTHGDYYSHLPNLVLSQPAGRATDNDADNATSTGATLYRLTTLQNDYCKTPGYHYINVTKAQKWVQKRRENSSTNDSSPINTYSEWFSYCFIKSLFHAILDPKNKLDGLRIYLGKGDVTNYTNKDIFVLVPTFSDGVYSNDYFQCLEDVEPKFCRAPSNFSKTKLHQGIGTDLGWMKGGYDNGELCPDVCN